MAPSSSTMSRETGCVCMVTSAGTQCADTAAGRTSRKTRARSAGRQGRQADIASTQRLTEESRAARHAAGGGRVSGMQQTDVSGMKHDGQLPAVLATSGGQTPDPDFFISRHIVVRLTCSSRAAAAISPWWRASVATIISRSARSRAAATVPSAPRDRERPRDDLLRQIVGLELRTARDRDRALDDVLELTDVARDSRTRAGRPTPLAGTRRHRCRAPYRSRK